MMLPNQINNQRFSAVGKGGYRASEVDAFIQRVFQNYNKLYNENVTLKERFAAITPLIDEYNENKKSIADALIWAKSTSDKTVDQAQQEAKDIIDSATAEGERIIAEKAKEAQEVYAQELSSTKSALESAKNELEMTRNQAKSFSERYIDEINAKAMSVIEDANENASKIVADAYKDAQTAREKADRIIADANKELAVIKAEASKFKSEIEKAVKLVSGAVGDITIEELETESVPEIIEAKQIDTAEIEEFSLDFSELSEDNNIYEDSGLDEKETDEPSFTVETVFGEEYEANAQESEYKEDFISGGENLSSMPDVSTYISKIFDSAGSESSDFSSFADGLNDVFAQSLEDSDINFADIKNSMISDEDIDEAFDEE